MKNQTVKSKVSTLCLLLTALAFAGCEVLQTPITPKVASTPALPPDYNLPDSQFVTAKFNTLASEFLDEYIGQYVVFDGRYLSHQQGALINTPTGPVAASDLMSGMIGAPDTSGAAARTVTVLWNVDDRELGRPFLNLAPNAPVKIYAYVRPANRVSRMKSRQDTVLSALSVPVVLLIKAVPPGSQ